MRSVLFTICFCLIATVCSAEKYYVFIDKIGKVYVGEEAGHTAEGDVVGISPFTSQYKPTRAELARYRVIVVDLTHEDRGQLLESETKVDGQDSEGNDIIVVVRARKRKIDFESFSNKKQEADITKNEIFQKVTVKFNLITDIR